VTDHPVKDQPAKPSGFKSGLLILILVSVFAFGLTVWWRPDRRPAAPVAAPLPTVSRTNLIRLNDRWVQAGGTNPFTGILVEFYPGGVMESRSVVSNGRLNGLSQGWFTNGQMQISESYRSNLSDGLRTRWYPNGHKLSEAAVVRGKIQGVFRHWHQDGTLAEEITMKDGVEQGPARAYYPSGWVRTELLMQDGKLVSQKSWKDGEKKGD